MHIQFTRIGIIGQRPNSGVVDTLQNLIDFLISLKLKIFWDEKTATNLPGNKFSVIPLAQFKTQCDLVIVVGGDGAMLGAARCLAGSDIPVLGINRGKLGFLTDINPAKIVAQVGDVLAGHYQKDQRFLLQANIVRKQQTIPAQCALNDVVLCPGKFSKMIEFEVFLDDSFVYSLRADGLVVATPTGSTAHALSLGGPILTPNLDALVLVPIAAHNLSCRPIVIDSNSRIEIRIANSSASPQLSCDGMGPLPLETNDRICIVRHNKSLCLIHPHDHNTYQTLRSKLHWGKKLFP